MKEYHIIFRNIAGSVRQSWCFAPGITAAIETFKKDCGHMMDPDHSPLNIKEMDQGVAVNRWYMENTYKGLPEKRDV